MTTDNRTNKPTAEQIVRGVRKLLNRYSLRGDVPCDEIDKLIDDSEAGLLSEGTPSEAQIERAAKAMQNESGGFFSLESWRHQARVALTAAGVATQEPSGVTNANGHSWMTWEESGKNGTYCRSCGGWAGKVGNRQCSPAPVLPSSG